MTSFPETGKSIPALQNLEVFATTEIVNNETAELSTHVLPTKDPLERPDITIHDILSSRVSVQYSPAVVDPVGYRRSMWWVFAELGRRLGYDLGSLGNPDSSTDDDVLAVLLAGARTKYDEVATTGWAEIDRELPALLRHVSIRFGFLRHLATHQLCSIFRASSQVSDERIRMYDNACPSAIAIPLLPVTSFGSRRR